MKTKPPALFSERQIANFNLIIDWWIQKQTDHYNAWEKRDGMNLREVFWGSRIIQAKEVKRLINYEFTDNK